MENYRVLIKPSAKKELPAVSNKKDRQRIVRRIEALAENPRPPGCERLSGYDRYRLRQGRYRVVYEIRDSDVLVVAVKVGHRRDIYRTL
ncbi:MAG: type II toxin-antitoxin system RelE/ParE family toxin [Gammaproteobacteria bacterium]|nr:type II toxin-antitoxin system RelE/ParE family toxin [Gammaproteobacteria bacterium]MDH3507780.1 type II toxin-antitoxin system RelE/ParE family toxin [Gammaproteobacteria bacterium]